MRSKNRLFLSCCLVCWLVTGCARKPAVPVIDVGELFVVLHELSEIAEETGTEVEPRSRAQMKPLGEYALQLLKQLPVDESDKAAIFAYTLRIPTADMAWLEDEARRIRDRVAQRNPLPRGPSTRPDAVEGAHLYAASCAPCHGASGVPRPEVAAAMSPPPTDLRNMARQPFLDVAWVYLVITHGVPTTPMPAFGATVSESDRWNLARYVWSLR